MQHAADINVAILFAGAAAVLYTCLKSVAVFQHNRQAALVNRLVDADIHAHTLHLDYACYDNPAYLDVLKRAREAGTDRPYAVVSSLFDIGKNALMLAGMGYILTAINWLLLPLIALFAVPVLLVRMRFADRLYAWQKAHTGMEREASYLSTLVAGDAAAKEVRFFGLGGYLLAKYNYIRASIFSHQIRHSRRQTFLEILCMAIVTAAFFVVMAIIVSGILQGKSSVGDVAMFIVIFPQAFANMQQMGEGLSRLYQHNRYLADVFALLALKPAIEIPVGAPAAAASQQTDFVVDHVSFRYPHATETVLEQVYLRIPAGKIVAVVGLNGAGKSTLIKLLCRLYDPAAGAIRMGGRDIREMDIQTYRRHVSVVFQDFVQYHTTVKENIWFGNLHAPPDDVALQQAATNAGAAGYIEGLAGQYDTLLGRSFEQGKELSTGQWQKLAIARALYGNAQLVILDEATSALDPLAEQQVFANLKQSLGTRSALVISHRLSTIQQADLIYVMEHKKIIAYGTHEALLTQSAAYASLYQSQ